MNKKARWKPRRRGIVSPHWNEQQQKHEMFILERSGQFLDVIKLNRELCSLCRTLNIWGYDRFKT
jgi:hypothetical protein